MRLLTSSTVSEYMCEVTVMAAPGTLLSRMTDLAMTYQGNDLPGQAGSTVNSAVLRPCLPCLENGHKDHLGVPGPRGFRMLHKEEHWLGTRGPAILAACNEGFLNTPG